MNNKEQQNNNTTQAQKTKITKSKAVNKEIAGLDIDKAEYQEIVLSNSNFPDRDFYRQNY